MPPRRRRIAPGQPGGPPIVDRGRRRSGDSGGRTRGGRVISTTQAANATALARSLGFGSANFRANNGRGTNLGQVNAFLRGAVNRGDGTAAQRRAARAVIRRSQGSR